MWIVGAGFVKDEIGGRTGKGNGVNQQKHRIQRNGIRWCLEMVRRLLKEGDTLEARCGSRCLGE